MVSSQYAAIDVHTWTNDRKVEKANQRNASNKITHFSTQSRGNLSHEPPSFAGLRIKSRIIRLQIEGHASAQCSEIALVLIAAFEGCRVLASSPLVLLSKDVCHTVRQPLGYPKVTWNGYKYYIAPNSIFRQTFIWRKSNLLLNSEHKNLVYKHEKTKKKVCLFGGRWRNDFNMLLLPSIAD